MKYRCEMCGEVVDGALVEWMGRVEAHYIGPLRKSPRMQRALDYCGPVHMVNEPKGDTDTHLNAAASDMLAALTAIRDATDEDELIDAHQKMHDAIAKAEA